MGAVLTQPIPIRHYHCAGRIGMFQSPRPICKPCNDSLKSNYLPAFWKCYVDNVGNKTDYMEKCCRTPVSTTSDGYFKWCIEDHSSDTSKYFEPFENCVENLCDSNDVECIHGGYPFTEYEKPCPVPPVATTPQGTTTAIVTSNSRNQTNSASATRMRTWSTFATGLLALILVGQTLAYDSSTMALRNCTHPVFGR